jgi:CBS-domain-containing membrane protein
VALGPTVALADAAMRATRSFHPPAGAEPIIMVMRHAADPSLVFETVLVGTLLMVTLAVVWHARVTGRAYSSDRRFRRPSAVDRRPSSSDFFRKISFL